MNELFAHQQKSIEFARGKPAVFDASDPGTGKTRVHIELIRPRRTKTLVLAPKSLLRNAWANDLRKFAPELMYSVATADNREKAFRVDADVYITNHDAAKWLAEAKPSFFRKFDGGTLLIDESNAYKHHTSQRSKAIGKITKYFDFRACLNGTPNTNGILDVWHQYKLLDDGQRLGKSFYAFRNAVCQPEQNGPLPNMVKWVDRPGAETAVADLVSDITIRHRFEDCVDIPPNHLYTVPFVLNPSHRAKYNVMKEAAILPLREGTVSAINAASVATKLLQIASGAVYESEGVYHLIDGDRYELVMDLLEPRDHSLVFFQWKHQRDELVRRAEERGYSYVILDGETTDRERESIVQQFEAGYYKAMFAHPKSTAHGLTLVKARTTIWPSPTYNLEFFYQGNKRIYRIGQTEKTETIVIIGEDTTDERVFRVLTEKGGRMDALLEELLEDFRAAA